MKKTLPLFSHKQTAYFMKKWIKKYHNDINNIFAPNRFSKIRLSEFSINDFYDFVRKIPYRQDKRKNEVVARPSTIIRNRHLGADCKKKAILICSYARCNGLPYRLIGSSSKSSKQVHHVYPQLFIFSNWVNCDATYPNYRLGMKKNEETYSEIL